MRIILALGGNIGNTAYIFQKIIEKLPDAGVETVKRSLIYISKSLLKDEQPYYMNMAVLGDTELAPMELLRAVKTIEREYERQEGRWQAREADIDILDYGGEIINEPELVIPHPRLHERSFALYPIRDVLPDYVHPCIKKSVDTLILELKEKLDIYPLQS